MGGVKVNGGPEITKMNRPVQAALLAGTVLPQAWCFATQSGPSAPEQLAQWWAWSTQDAAGWLLSASFLAAFLALAFERMLYTIVWIRPKAWMAMSKTQPFVRLGSPVDVVCADHVCSVTLDPKEKCSRYHSSTNNPKRYSNVVARIQHKTLFHS